MAPQLKERIEKLPLTVRKNLRDEWEAKKGDFEAQISDIAGQSWTIEVDVNQVYPYADDSYNARLGNCIVWYIEPFVSNLKQFIQKFGEDGKTELNKLVSNHKLVFGPQTTTTFTYGGLVVQDGDLHLVFADGSFVSNVSDVSKDFGGALATAAASSANGGALNITARQAIRTDWDPKIEPVHDQIKKYLNMPDIKLNPNWDAVAAELAKSDISDWRERIANLALAYFKGFSNGLRRAKFDGDDMLQEGFQEAAEKKEVRLRVFQKWPEGKSRYNETVVEDGIVYLQTTVENWGSNTDDVSDKITDIL